MLRARALVIAALASCSAPRAPDRPREPPPDPQQAFWSQLHELCGHTFDGAIAINTGGGDAPDPFQGKVLRMHVRECSDLEIRVPFHVGDDRSRTWVFTRVPGGLRLKHDHRHDDGTPHEVTMYGGETVEVGTPSEQRFPADEDSRNLFIRQNLHASVSNVWIVSLERGERYSYALERPDREFRIDFDLRTPKQEARR